MLHFIRENGTRVELRAYWGERDCPNCLGYGGPGYHDATLTLRVLPENMQWDAAERCFASRVDREASAEQKALLTKCDHCPAAVPPGAHWQVNELWHYDSPSGKAEPNDVFWRVYGPGHYCAWDDCDGRHLVIVLPIPGTHWEWDTAQRATNCSAPADRRHRCWVIAGEPPMLSSVLSPRRCHGDKRSIETPGFHKTLENGEWA